jgi:maltooligosyltrehalose trehalohydrolase
VRVSGHRLVGFLQNHDHVGNRPGGERTSQLLDPARLRAGAALVLTGPCVPMLFQGEEWGASTPFHYFTDHGSPDLARAVRAGRRRELAASGWPTGQVPDPEAPETFEASRLDWAERDRPPHRDLLRWHRDLVRLRRSEPALLDGSLDRAQLSFDEERRWISVARGSVTILCNFDVSPQELPLASGRPRRVLLASEPPTRARSDRIALTGGGVAILG